MYGAVKQENLTNLILVLQSKMTSKARDGVKEISKIKVEMFQVISIPCSSYMFLISLLIFGNS